MLVGELGVRGDAGVVALRDVQALQADDHSLVHVFDVRVEEHHARVMRVAAAVLGGGPRIPYVGAVLESVDVGCGAVCGRVFQFACPGVVLCDEASDGPAELCVLDGERALDDFMSST